MKLYFEAEKFLKPNKGTNGSLQSRIFNDKRLTNPKTHICLGLFYIKVQRIHRCDCEKSKIQHDLQIKK